ACKGNGADEAAPFSKSGRHWGAAEMSEQARLANVNEPTLKTFDAKGFRRDIVEFHPAYHAFMAESIGAGLHAMTWTRDGSVAGPPSEVARAPRSYMGAQGGDGPMCP